MVLEEQEELPRAAADSPIAVTVVLELLVLLPVLDPDVKDRLFCLCRRSAVLPYGQPTR